MNKSCICGIYYIKNTINDKYYVGQSRNIKRRWRREKLELNGDADAWNIHLQRAWKKYGQDNFEFSIIETCIPEQLDEREQFWIAFYNSYDDGYNQSLGGGGVSGWRHTDESRTKIANKIRQSITPERQLELSKNSREYWSDEESRERMREQRKQWWANPDNRARTLDAMKNADKVVLRGKDHPLYGTDKSGLNSTHHRSCVQIETGVFYYTLTEASKQTGASLSKVCAVCNGRRKTAGGYHWRYATKEEIADYLSKTEVAV
jgi:group I intron endonuclease